DAADEVEVDRPADGDLDLPCVALHTRALVAQDREERLQALAVADAGEEAIAVARGAPRGGVGVSADDDRHARLLHRLRVRLERRPAEEAARERLRRVAPERADRGDGFARPRRALGERDAERVELLLQPADADAEDRAAAGQ